MDLALLLPGMKETFEFKGIILFLILLGGLILPLQAGNAASNDREQFLEAHNRYRRLHGVPEVIWSATLAASAQDFISSCPTTHARSGFGENMAWANYSMPVADVVQLWYAEEKDYDYSNPKYSSSTGHFTQLVWKDTTEIGCAYQQQCTNELFQSSVHTAWVCQYNPPGNYLGHFADNVFPPVLANETQSETLPIPDLSKTSQLLPVVLHLLM